MTALDLSLIFFLVSALVKITVDFIEHDREMVKDAKSHAVRKTTVAPNTIRTINNYYKTPAKGSRRAVRTSLNSSKAKIRPIKRAI